MTWLLTASFIWAFSFGLIRSQIAGIDPFVLGTLRTVFALLVFLPFFRPSGITWRQARGLFLAGFLQLGLMYGPYLYSFKILQAHEVALFTMTTPLYVVGLNLLLSRKLSLGFIACAGLAVVGGSIVAWKGLASPDLLQGILLVQLSNLLFAVGQQVYTASAQATGREQLFHAAVYFGGAMPGSLLLLVFLGTSPQTYSATQWLVFAWLGIAATGLGYFLWNFGATKTKPGLLAVSNNLKLPMAVAVSIFVFGERNVEYVRIVSGCSLLALSGWLVTRLDAKL